MTLHILESFRNSFTNKKKLVDCFFIDQIDYFDFQNFGTEKVVENEAKTCRAVLRKEGNVFLYTLTWLDDDVIIGEYVKTFTANIENIEKFKFGCKILANRMNVYLRTKNIHSIPEYPKAFGDLTYVDN